MDGPGATAACRPAPGNVLTTDGTFCGVIDFGDLCAGDPAYDLAAVWLLLPEGTTDHFYAAYQPTPDAATIRRARGWAMARALGGILIGDAGVHGRPGGKPTWGPRPRRPATPHRHNPLTRRSPLRPTVGVINIRTSAHPHTSSVLRIRVVEQVAGRHQ
jgi:hypothetical protein